MLKDVIETLSHYKIISKLGSGGMGEVYLAQDTKLDRTVALKILPRDVASDPERMRRFVQEAKAASALDHPNVAQIYEIGESDGTTFIAMQYIEGQTLEAKSHIKQLETKEIVDVAIQVADALDAANSKGIIHRDIKAANIMVTPRGQVKVLDFGLAKVESKISSHPEASKLETEAGTTPGLILGTVQYMSPEQALGKRIDSRSDIYSLGVVLYQLATSRLPFAGPTPSVTLSRILNTQPDAIARFNYDIDPELERIIRKCMEKDPERRYQSARELEIDLKNLKRDSESGASQMGSPAGLRPASTKSRWKLYAGLAALALAVIGAAMIYYIGMGRGQAIHSLAVLPFSNARSDPETEYLSDGITESITNSMSPIPELRVLSQGMVRRFKDKEIDPQQLGRELNVDALVQGSLAKQGDTLVVNAELVRSSDGAQLWGQQYNRKLSDILLVQQDISAKVSEQLRLKLSGEERKKIQNSYTENTEAYQLYLKGLYYWNRRTGLGLQKALGYFQQAIEQDPNYALAYAGVAGCYAIYSRYDLLPPRESMPLGKRAAMQALKIDPSLPEARIALAHVMTEYEWDWAGASKEFQQALATDPNYATGHQWYAEHLMAIGQLEEGLKEIQKAHQLDPLSLQIRSILALSYYSNRQYDLAIDVARKGIELDPNFARLHFRLGQSLIKKSLFDEAISEFKMAMSLAGNPPTYLAGLGQAYAASGKKAEALQIIEQLEKLSKEKYVPSYQIALVYVELGDKDQTFEWLEKAFNARDDWLDQFRTDPSWDPIRSDQRYKDLLRRMNIPS
jgi:eukaryotic-like serine/threonine-protein kinase